MGQSQSCTYGERRRAVAVCSIDLRLRLCEALFLRSASTPHNRFSVRLMTAPPARRRFLLRSRPLRRRPRRRLSTWRPVRRGAASFSAIRPTTWDSVLRRPPPFRSGLKRITRCSRAPPLLAVCPSDRGHPGPGRAVFISNLMSLKAR